MCVECSKHVSRPSPKELKVAGLAASFLRLPAAPKSFVHTHKQMVADLAALARV